MKKALRETQTLRAGGAGNFRPAEDPLPGAVGQPKFNKLEMVTTFTYNLSLVKIDACNFELSCNRPTNKHTNPQTGPITIHCAANLSAQCN